jgi:hypothetical protein
MTNFIERDLDDDETAQRHFDPVPASSRLLVY